MDVQLQDLHNESASSDLESEVSVVFDEIGYVNKGADEFSEDPDYQQTVALFTLQIFSKKQTVVFFSLIMAIWAGSLIYYAFDNVSKVPQLLHGPKTSVVPLANRNVTLNAYLTDFHNVTLTDFQTGKYVPEAVNVEWLRLPQFPTDVLLRKSGYFLMKDGKQFVVGKANSKFRVPLLDVQFSVSGKIHHAESLQLNPQIPCDKKGNVFLVSSDSEKQFRHLSFARFWLWDTATNATVPLTSDSHKLSDLLHFAMFDPSGKFVLFGQAHNLYLYDLEKKTTRTITDTGSPSVFNGKPDWVYEEEVYPRDRMVWFSESSLLAFATLNDTKVEDYSITYSSGRRPALTYYALAGSDVRYPAQVEYKYPKPGGENPIVSVNVYNVTSGETTVVKVLEQDVGHDFILYDVAWVGDDLLLKVADRTSSTLVKQAYANGKVEVVSRTNATEYGWVEKQQPVVVIKDKYLDRVVENGTEKIALFLLRDAKPEIIIGETAKAPIVYNPVTERIYYMRNDGMARVFVMASLDGNIADISNGENVYSVNFSEDGQFASIICDGPEIPWQKLVDIDLWESPKDLEETPVFVSNDKLKSLHSRSNMPTRVYSQVTLDKSVTVDMMEILPPNFNSKRQHPLLVFVYGGPGSSTVDLLYLVTFQDIVSSQLDAVVLVIEPRTAGDNWLQKAFARHRLGHYEPRDIVDVTKDYIKIRGYIDKTKTAIWGWSFGGFTTLKTLELDKGETFKYGMAVAPVTNWMFYDSVFTERHMKQVDEKYNATAIVKDYQNLKKATRFLIAHGTADDNVHVHNSLWLVDKLDVAGVRNYDTHFFPDSDHTISFHNGFVSVHDRLFIWLQKAFAGLYD